MGTLKPRVSNLATDSDLIYRACTGGDAEAEGPVALGVELEVGPEVVRDLLNASSRNVSST